MGCHFGPNLAPFCFRKSVQILPKNGSQEASIFSSISTSIFERFGVQLGAILGPKVGLCWRPKSYRNNSGRVHNRPGRLSRRAWGARIRPDPLHACFLIDFFEFFIDFGTLGIPPKSLKIRLFFKVFFALRLFQYKNRFGMPFWSQLGSILLPKIHPNLPPKPRSQDGSSMPFLLHHLFDAFLGRF